MVKKKTRNVSAFTIMEIFVIIAVLGILLAIAIPNFVTARSRVHDDMCINNLRQIELAKEQWSIENDKDASDPAPTPAELDSYVREDIWDETATDYTSGHGLICPQDSNATPTFNTSYTVNAVDTDATCKIKTNHRL